MSLRRLAHFLICICLGLHLIQQIVHVLLEGTGVRIVLSVCHFRIKDYLGEDVILVPNACIPVEALILERDLFVIPADCLKELSGRRNTLFVFPHLKLAEDLRLELERLHMPLRVHAKHVL